MRVGNNIVRMFQSVRQNLTGYFRWRPVLYLLLFVLGLNLQPVHAIESQNELTLKVAFLYNFARFSEWPPAAFDNDDAILVIGVLGNNPFGDMLHELEGKTVRKQKIVVTQFNDATDAKQCHLLFISKSLEEGVSSVLDKVAGSPVLTVSDMDEFAGKGGMIQMFPDGGKIRFNVNLTSANKSSITIRSALLQLARKIIGR